MFGIGWTELVLIGVMALLILGPDKLPELARQMGKWMRELRAVSADLRDEFRAEFGEQSPAQRPSGRVYAGDNARTLPATAGAPPDVRDGFGRPVRRRRDQRESESAEASNGG